MYVDVEKHEPSQTRVGHGRSEASLNSLQPTEGSFQLVTGRVQRILTRAVMLGNMGLTSLKVSARFVGSYSPCSRSCCCHYIFQMCSSLSKQSHDGRSSSYSSASSLTLEVQSAGSSETYNDGTKQRPSSALLWYLLKRPQSSDSRWSTTGIDPFHITSRSLARDQFLLSWCPGWCLVQHKSLPVR